MTLIGLLAGGLTTFSFAPQLYRSIKTKSVADVSLGMYSAMVTGVVLWEIYAIMINSLPLIITNIVSFVLTLSVLIVRLWYGRKPATGHKVQDYGSNPSLSSNR